MKKITLITLLLVFILALNFDVNAQKISLKTNPINYGLGGSSLMTEFKLNESVSLQVNLGNFDVQGYTETIDIFGFTGGSIINSLSLKAYLFEPQFRFYFKNSFDGWFFSPSLVVNYYSLSYDEDINSTANYQLEFNTSLWFVGLGATAGYKKIFKNGFTFDFDAGLAAGQRMSVISQVDNMGSDSGFFALPKVNLGVGYSF